MIGRDGQLPWRLPSDLKHFRKLTLGKPVIMGRKTFELHRQAARRPRQHRRYAPEALSTAGVHGADTIAGAVALGQELASRRGANEVTIIGGAEVFRLRCRDAACLSHARTWQARRRYTLGHPRPDCLAGDLP